MAIDYELKEVFDISKFTIVGSPNITDDGIASGFSAGNWLNIGSISLTNNFVLCFQFTTGNDVISEQQILTSDTGRYLVFKIQNSKTSLAVGNGSSWAFGQVGDITLQPNMTYLLKIVFDGIKYETYLNNALNGITNSTNVIPQYSCIVGVSNNYNFTGSIDLKQFSITVDGTEVFKGTKTVVAKIPPEVIGSGSSVPMDYVAALEELQNYYANLLIIQYHNKPKAIGMIKSLVRALYADMMVFKIRDGFNLVNQPYAIGKQLDCIGEWVGVNRIYDAGQPLYPWFSLIDAEQTTEDVWQGGFQDWNDPIAQDGGFLGFDDLVMGANKTALADDLFLALIKMKIIKNSSTHTMGDLDKKFYEYFGSDIYITWDGMEMTYNYINKYNALMEISQIKNALPIPNGSIVHLNPL